MHRRCQQPAIIHGSVLVKLFGNTLFRLQQALMESTNDDAFEIIYRLDVPVRSGIYDYIVRD